MSLKGDLAAFSDATIIDRLRGLDDFGKERNLIWWFLSANASVTWAVVRALPKKPWDYRGLSRNPNIRWKHVLEAPKAGWDAKCFYDDPDSPGVTEKRRINYRDDEFLAKHPSATWETLTAPGLRAVWFRRDTNMLLQNPSVANIKTIKENPGFFWELFTKSLAKNPAIDNAALSELFKVRPEVIPEWDWGEYSRNRSLSWKTVARFRGKPWDTYYLSMNPRVVDWARWTARPLGLGPGETGRVRPWDWNGLSRNPAMATWERVCARPELPWDWESLAGNRAVARWDTCTGAGRGAGPAACCRPAAWQPYATSYVWMSMDICTERERLDFILRWKAARRIQRAFKEAIANPEKGLCQRRLRREMGDLGAI